MGQDRVVLFGDFLLDEQKQCHSALGYDRQLSRYNDQDGYASFPTLGLFVFCRSRGCAFLDLPFGQVYRY
jgi:hypothetical protein